MASRSSDRQRRIGVVQGFANGRGLLVAEGGNYEKGGARQRRESERESSRRRLCGIRHGDNETRSIGTGLIALIAGTVAIVRIKRYPGTLWGMFFAVTGVVCGGFWVALWVFMIIASDIGIIG